MGKKERQFVSSRKSGSEKKVLGQIKNYFANEIKEAKRQI